MTDRRLTVFRIALAFAVLSETALGQNPPCLGPFQRVDALVPVLVNPPIGLHVDGHDAVLWSEYGGPYPFDYGLHFFREDPATGTWSATESRLYPGPTFNRHVALRDGVVAYLHFGDPLIEFVILEREPVTGIWQRLGAVPAPPYFELNVPQLLVSRELVAVQGSGSVPSTVWRRGPAGYALAISFPTGENSILAVDGERVVRALTYHAELYRCPATGGSELLGYIQAPSSRRFRSGVHIDGERLVADVAGIEGVATWRVEWDTPSGASAVLDTVTPYSAGIPHGTGSLGSSFGAGSLLTQQSTLCSGGPFGSFTASFVEVGTHGHLHVAGAICVEMSMPFLPLRSVSTDGRTVARLHRDAAGHTSVEFARYLGAALDRDRDCVPDTDQIRMDARLDLNANARLDAFERGGEAFCAQLAPNSTGSFASLELIGSESVHSSDLAAVARALPPHAVGASTFTFAPRPLPANATSALGLCILGARHPAVAADARGVAVVAIHPSALPTRVGSASAIAGQTWAWQHVYRDGATVAVTPAVAVELW
jgi:hypothetical protein